MTNCAALLRMLAQFATLMRQPRELKYCTASTCILRHAFGTLSSLNKQYASCFEPASCSPQPAALQLQHRRWKKTKSRPPAVSESRPEAGSSVSSVSSSATISELVDEVRRRATGVEEMLLEVNAGAGGVEAALFAAELLGLYRNFAQHCGWNCRTEDADENNLGGMRIASIAITGTNAINLLKYEGGVHRVQRVPATEKAGRIHTSTVAVAVLVKPADISVVLKPGDLEIQTCRATGAGGQHVNKTNSAVRILHKPTGVAVECQEERSQFKNKAVALEKLAAILYETQMEKQQSSSTSARKVQVGSLARSEKIRTYNFPQDRITDHRINMKINNIADFFLGKERFQNLVQALAKADAESAAAASMNLTKKRSQA